MGIRRAVTRSLPLFLLNAVANLWRQPPVDQSRQYETQLEASDPDSCAWPDSDAPARESSRPTIDRASDPDTPCYTAQELAGRLQVSRATVSAMRRDGRIYAVRLDGRSYGFPKTQIQGSTFQRKARIAPGISEVLARFETREAAWIWLNSQCPDIATPTRPRTHPLEELRRGRHKAVLSAMDKPGTA